MLFKVFERKTYCWFGLLVIQLFLIGCQPNNKAICNKPYFEFKLGECCLDKDNNQICDADEKQPNLSSGNELSEVVDKQKLAEQVALKFARAWESQDWDSLYDLLIKDLRRLRSKERFLKQMQKKDYEGIVIRVDKVEIENETGAYAYSTFSGSFINARAPAIKMVWDGYGWYVNAFSSVFDSCDDLIKDCCGNNLCEVNEDGSTCSDDCQILNSNFNIIKEPKKELFLGKSYEILVLNRSERQPFILMVSINGREIEFNLSKTFKLDKARSFYLGDNVYVIYRTTDGLTFFNRD